jgi:hypothetical protein
MADTPFPPLKREPLLGEELPAANPTVRLIKGARIKFAPGSRPDCIVIRSRLWGW